jgi:hypothetical protein
VIAFWQLLSQFAGGLSGKQPRDLDQRSYRRTVVGFSRI